MGHVTSKIVSEMTYNVSSGTLNSTIPSTYQSIFVKALEQDVTQFCWDVVCARCGGVEMVAQDGKIKLDNTLDSRLASISRQVCAVSAVYYKGLTFCHFFAYLLNIFKGYWF